MCSNLFTFCRLQPKLYLSISAASPWRPAATCSRGPRLPAAVIEGLSQLHSQFSLLFALRRKLCRFCL